MNPGYTTAHMSAPTFAELAQVFEQLRESDLATDFRGKCELLERNILPAGMIVLLSPDWNGGKYGVCVQSQTIEDLRRVLPDASDRMLAEELAAFASSEHKKKQEAQRG